MAAFPKYESYKDSGVEWLGEIPSHWNVRRLKYLFQFHTGGTPSSTDNRYYDGDYFWASIGDLKTKIITETKTTINKSGIEKARILLTPKGSLLFSFKLSVGQTAFAGVDLYTNEAIASFLKTEKENLEYWFYALSIFVPKNANKNIYGADLLNQDLIKNALLLCPPVEEQKRIANFLDRKTAEIDQAIAQKQRLIELLQEQKAILINQAVTKGLDPNVPMCDRGVEWIGEIPKHWKICQAKYLFKEVNERSKTGLEELLSVSHMTGVTPRSEKNVSMFMAEDYSGSKLCQKDDLVINIMWAWMGALGVSAQTGIVSPSYGVFRQLKPNTFNSWYLEHLLRSTEYVAEYNRRSTGLHSSRLRLYAHMFLSLEIAFPAKEEQDRIEAITIERTLEIETAIDAVKREIKALEEFCSIIISQAVTGKIKVQETLISVEFP